MPEVGGVGLFVAFAAGLLSCASPCVLLILIFTDSLISLNQFFQVDFLDFGSND